MAGGVGVVAGGSGSDGTGGPGMLTAGGRNGGGPSARFSGRGGVVGRTRRRRNGCRCCGRCRSGVPGSGSAGSGTRRAGAGRPPPSVGRPGAGGGKTHRRDEVGGGRKPDRRGPAEARSDRSVCATAPAATCGRRCEVIAKGDGQVRLRGASPGPRRRAACPRPAPRPSGCTSDRGLGSFAMKYPAASVRMPTAAPPLPRAAASTGSMRMNTFFAPRPSGSRTRPARTPCDLVAGVEVRVLRVGPRVGLGHAGAGARGASPSNRRARPALGPWIARRGRRGRFLLVGRLRVRTLAPGQGQHGRDQSGTAPPHGFAPARRIRPAAHPPVVGTIRTAVRA